MGMIIFMKIVNNDNETRIFNVVPRSEFHLGKRPFRYDVNTIPTFYSYFEFGFYS